MAGTQARETPGREAERSAVSPKDRSVDVGDFQLHIDCTGTAPLGLPAVILESSGGVPAFGRKFVQPDIAKFTRVWSYNRAGMGIRVSSGERSHDLKFDYFQL